MAKPYGPGETRGRTAFRPRRLVSERGRTPGRQRVPQPHRCVWRPPAVGPKTTRPGLAGTSSGRASIGIPLSFPKTRLRAARMARHSAGELAPPHGALRSLRRSWVPSSTKSWLQTWFACSAWKRMQKPSAGHRHRRFGYLASTLSRAYAADQT